MSQQTTPTTKREKVDNLIKRIEEYYSENKIKGEFRLNDWSIVLDGEKYLSTNISVMKRSDPFSMTFNACYSRLIELKTFIEKSKK